MTEELCRQDAYLKNCEAVVLSSKERAICVDRTVFYPLGGGQPGDTGRLIRANGEILNIIDTRKDRDSGQILHFTDSTDTLPEEGEQIRLEIDWDRRYRLMRMHSCMHMLCTVVQAPVTGGSIRDGSARLDFNLPEPPDKLELERELNTVIAADHPQSLSWISDAELAAQPDLVRTMSVKPPLAAGKVRLVKFGDIDLQPCGGTHVASSSEIGPVKIRKIEKKGKLNRRITIEFAKGHLY